MKTMFFNFTEGKEVNPLEGVKKFFINPINPKLYLKLKIEKICESVKPRYRFDRGLPVFIYPLVALGLETCTVSFATPTNGMIITKRGAILFHIQGEFLVVDSVLDKVC